jgi:membrane protein required for colicin V production
VAPPASWPAPLDLVGLAAIGVLLLLGLYRGLWWQVMRLVGVTFSVLIARAGGAPLALRLAALFPDLEARTAHGIAWGVLFGIALLASALLGLLGQRMLEAMKLDLANRLAGGFAGAMTGFCVHVVLVFLFCHLAPAPLLGRYVAGTWSERIYTALGIRWPVVMAAEGTEDVDRILEQAPRKEPRPAPRRAAEPEGVVR